MKLVFNGLLLMAILTSAIGLPFFALAQDYTLLEPSVLSAGQTTDGKVDFATYIKSGFKTFLAVVVIIAIVMLTASGLQYITAGSGGGKGEAKNRALAAILGLLIDLSAYLILRTINPDLVDLTLDVNDQPRDGGRDISAPTNPPNTGSGVGGVSEVGGGNYDQNLGALAGPKEEGETNAEAILRNAQFAANNASDTCHISGTQGGRLACAATVNGIVEVATGEQVGGNLSTNEMYNALQQQPERFEQVGRGGIGMSSAKPGDIIITPSNQGVGGQGHVGICETTGCQNIISNQSSSATVGRGIDDEYWRNTYGVNNVYIFRPIG